MTLLVFTPWIDLVDFLKIPLESCVKTLLVDSDDGGVIALVLRGDDQLNMVKASRLPGVANPIALAGEATVRAVSNDPARLASWPSCPVFADHRALNLANFVCGANRDGIHLTGVNWGRDLDGASGGPARRRRGEPARTAPGPRNRPWHPR